MTTLAPKRMKFTVESYYKMAKLGLLAENRQVELINGDIIDMSPINSNHAGTVDLLVEQLLSKLVGRAAIRVQNPLAIDVNSEPEPDVVVAKLRPDRYRRQHPTPADTFIVIEVADSSLQFDREVKSELYAAAGIPEYWIVNLPDRQLEIYTQPKAMTYQAQRVITSTAELQLTVLGELIDLRELFLKEG